MSDGGYHIVNIATGQRMAGPFDSREAANSKRWLKFETGEADDPEYDEQYGVCKDGP